MRWWLTILILTTTIAVGNAQTFSIQWLSFVLNGGAPVPIRINPVSGLVDLINGITVDSRFPSVSADGTRIVFQVGSGNNAQVWEAVLIGGNWQTNPVGDADGDGLFGEDPIDGVDNDNDGLIDEDPPIQGLHPVISADGNHVAFASTQNYGFGSNGRQQIYVLDRTQNRIVPISVLWQDTNGDGVRDTYLPSSGNCIPVYVSSNGRIVVFLAEWRPNFNIVDENGDGNNEPVPPPPTADQWLILVHDRDADGNGVYDEAGIGSTRTFVGSYDELNRLAPTAALTVCANGRFIAFMTTYDNDDDGFIDEDPEGDINNDGNPDDDSDNQIDEDPPDERWRIVVRDWQNGTALSIDNAFVPALSDDGTYLAYLTPAQIDNDGDGQVNEDPVDNTDNDNDGQVDEDPPETYLQTTMDLVVRQLIDPTTGQPPAQLRELRLSGLQLPPQFGTADGTSGYGYSDWWGAATVAVDPTNPNIAYVAFHSWATNLIDIQSNLVRDDDGDGRVDEDPINGVDDDNDGQVDEDPPNNFYQGVPNIFVARFDFTPNAANPIQLWQLTPGNPPQPAWGPRALPVSLEPNGANTYRLPLAASLMPTVSFVNGGQLFVVFQSLAPFDQNDINGLWDIYLATVPLP
ncbi:MAG: hypothetical protein ACK40X_03585 [Armatimonadota bacterium]